VTTPAIRTIRRNTLYLVGTRAVNVLARLIWVVVAARILGPDLYALLAYSQAWQLAFLPLALFGVGQALSFLVAPDRSRAPEIAVHALAIRLVTIVVAAAACVILSRVVTPDPRAPVLIAVLSLALGARALTTFTQTLFTAFEINQHTMRQETLFSLLNLGVGIGVLLGGGGLLMLVTARAAVAWLQTAWAFFIAHRVAISIRLVWRPAEWRPLLRLALPALMITAAADWCFNGSLVLFRNLTTDGVLFAQYALAMQALAIAAILPLSLNRAVFPALRRAVARGDGKEILFASAMQRVAPLAGTAAGLLGWALGEPLFRWLLGEPFSTAGELVGLTLWCLIPLTATAGYPEILIAHGRFRTMVILNVAGATVMTLLTFLLVPTHGATGAITAALAGFSVAPIGAFMLAWRENMADPIKDVIRPFATATLGLGAYLALASFSRWAALAAGLSTLAAAVLALRVIGLEEMRAFRTGSSPG
jgi:O-antigen/teichoic acid export membrane protein